ncbi:MAG TPA: hypothetical protein VLE44_02440 [Candidatus Saccharimonadales bacterium]|nr:hypothetical protein [Candidatus Saccharimonadales bacterium]
MERCIRCESEMKPYPQNIAFYFCEGTETEPHAPYLLSTKFIDIILENMNNSKIEINATTPDKLIETSKI